MNIGIKLSPVFVTHLQNLINDEYRAYHIYRAHNILITQLVGDAFSDKLMAEENATRNWCSGRKTRMNDMDLPMRGDYSNVVCDEQSSHRANTFVVREHVPCRLAVAYRVLHRDTGSM